MVAAGESETAASSQSIKHHHVYHHGVCRTSRPLLPRYSRTRRAPRIPRRAGDLYHAGLRCLAVALPRFSSHPHTHAILESSPHDDEGWTHLHGLRVGDAGCCCCRCCIHLDTQACGPRHWPSRTSTRSLHATFTELDATNERLKPHASYTDRAFGSVHGAGQGAQATISFSASIVRRVGRTCERLVETARDAPRG